MKKRIYIIIVCLAVIVLAGIVFFNYSGGERMPECGTYFIPQNSYYVFENEEEMELGLDAFRVTKGNENSKYMFENCQNFRLLDDSGNEYPVNVQEEKVVQEDNDYNFAGEKVKINKYVVYVALTEKRDVNIVAIQYKDSNDRTVKENLGRIEIKYIENQDEYVEAASNRLNWISTIQPTFNHVELIIQNSGKADISNIVISYGETGIEIQDKINLTIPPDGEKELTHDVTLNNEEMGNPIVYYLKPEMEYSCDGVVKKKAFSNVSKEAFYGEQENILEYLYKIGEQSE